MVPRRPNSKGREREREKILLVVAGLGNGDPGGYLGGGGADPGGYSILG